MGGMPENNLDIIAKQPKDSVNFSLGDGHASNQIALEREFDDWGDSVPSRMQGSRNNACAFLGRNRIPAQWKFISRRFDHALIITRPETPSDPECHKDFRPVLGSLLKSIMTLTSPVSSDCPVFRARCWERPCRRPLSRARMRGVLLRISV